MRFPNTTSRERNMCHKCLLTGCPMLNTLDMYRDDDSLGDLDGTSDSVCPSEAFEQYGGDDEEVSRENEADVDEVEDASEGSSESTQDEDINDDDDASGSDDVTNDADDSDDDTDAASSGNDDQKRRLRGSAN